MRKPDLLKKTEFLIREYRSQVSQPFMVEFTDLTSSPVDWEGHA